MNHYIKPVREFMGNVKYARQNKQAFGLYTRSKIMANLLRCAILTPSEKLTNLKRRCNHETRI